MKHRTKRFVDKNVQGTLVRQITTHWLCFALLLCSLVAILNGLTSWLFDPMASSEQLVRGFLIGFGPVIVAVAILVPWFVYDSIRLTHRMVGPMVRVRREMKNLAGGIKAQRIQFRPEDYWQDLADEFNTFCDRVEPHVTN